MPNLKMSYSAESRAVFLSKKRLFAAIFIAKNEVCVTLTLCTCISSHFLPLSRPLTLQNAANSFRYGDVGIESSQSTCCSVERHYWGQNVWWCNWMSPPLPRPHLIPINVSPLVTLSLSTDLEVQVGVLFVCGRAAQHNLLGGWGTSFRQPNHEHVLNARLSEKMNCIGDGRLSAKWDLAEVPRPSSQT